MTETKKILDKKTIAKIRTFMKEKNLRQYDHIIDNFRLSIKDTINSEVPYRVPYWFAFFITAGWFVTKSWENQVLRDLTEKSPPIFFMFILGVFGTCLFVASITDFIFESFKDKKRGFSKFQEKQKQIIYDDEKTYEVNGKIRTR